MVSTDVLAAKKPATEIAHGIAWVEISRLSLLSPLNSLAVVSKVSLSTLQSTVVEVTPPISRSAGFRLCAVPLASMP